VIFMEALRKGECTLNDADGYVEAWHTSDSQLPLHEYLDMTEGEYQLWVLNPNNLTVGVDMGLGKDFSTVSGKVVEEYCTCGEDDCPYCGELCDE
jgi:hypothetical protein